MSDTLIHSEATGRSSAPPLTVYVTLTEEVCTLWLTGSLVSGSLHELEKEIDRLGSLHFEVLVVDLAELTELDSVGANVILGLRHYVAGREACMTVRVGTPAIEDMLNQFDLAVQS